MNYKFLQNILFQLPTEASHHLSLQSMALIQKLGLSNLIAREAVIDPVEVMGIKFPNTVGLAAGLDKDGTCIEGLSAMGFGFIEVGTVTPRPQVGNPKPRLFRLKSRQAIINRMGFNNDGVDALIKRVRRSDYTGILGINIGKNADTPIEDTLADYEFCLRKVYKHADYVVVNISSPNTKDLRTLQHGDELTKLLEGLKAAHTILKEQHQKHVPLVVKIAPDMDDNEVVAICERLVTFELDGVIVSNTTVSRAALNDEKFANETGGLSGAPLRDQSNHVLEIVAAEVKRKIAVIGVGGVLNAEDAAKKISLGADLVQLYTGFIYEGPDLIYNAAMQISRYRLENPTA